MITDFNNPNRSVIIGLDHGYGNVKTAHTCFQAGVTRHEKEPTFFPDVKPLKEREFYAMMERFFELPGVMPVIAEAAARHRADEKTET